MPIRFFAAAFLFSCAAPSQAAETPMQLASRHLCLGCHALADVRAGPSFQDIAERYRSRPAAVEQLLASVRTGSTGRWGSTPMPPEPARVAESELRQILEWIVEQ